MPKIERMVHANICVRDMDTSVAFYEKVGFEKFFDAICEDGDVWRGLAVDGRRFRAVFMKIPGLAMSASPFLDIIQFLEPPTMGSAYPSLHHAGIARLCFEVHDIRKQATELEAKGIKLMSSVASFGSGDVAVEFICFKDPDGTVIEFIEWTGAGQPWSFGTPAAQ